MYDPLEDSAEVYVAAVEGSAVNAGAEKGHDNEEEQDAGCNL